MRRRWAHSCLLAMAACSKVPVVDIGAEFELAHAAWYQEEETLFFFYSVHAIQGLGEDSVFEVTYTTDDGVQPWTAIDELSPVHTHVAADCGPSTMCGSTSLHVRLVPRDIGIRLRYHREGGMALFAEVATNVIGAGPPYSHRSLVVYGVFDATNTLVQWRGRHQFPTLRNEEVSALGLRRRFVVDEQRYGALSEEILESPHGYGYYATCPPDFVPVAIEPVETRQRAAWNPSHFPQALVTAPAICARSTVEDARGEFVTTAVAKKNPEVRPAFPVLRSPIHRNTQIGFVLAPCSRTISAPHKAMQVQRLGLEDAPELCLDDWQSDTFVDSLVDALETRIDEARAAGDDMVLTLALHHDDTSGQLAGRIEAALMQVLPFESSKSSPRVTGAFVFDSVARTLRTDEIKPLVLWCPASLPIDDLESIPDAAQRSCAILPDNPSLELGPFRFGTLPILPTRTQYLNFLDKYSEGQAGEMTSISFRAPERTPISENVSLGEFGVITFFNNEILTAEPGDAFSYCPRTEALVVFRTSNLAEPMPLELLPEVHQLSPQDTYELGLFWDFPFLMRLDYRVFFAGAATAFSFTVPFGIGSSAESYYGAELWSNTEFPLDDTLLQCTRFCDHPTFDSAGVYDVYAQFRASYAHNCYAPSFVEPGQGGGFPRDP